MFRRIAEWITGIKRKEDKHPLEYVDTKQERIEQAKAESIVAKQEMVWTAGQPAVVVPAPNEVPTKLAATPIVPDPSTATSTSTDPWPFPKSAPEQTVEATTPVTEKKARKPRQKKS